MNTVYKVLIAAAFAVVLGVALANVYEQYLIHNVGTINTYSLKLYLDDTELSNNSAIDWGMCDAGGSYYFSNFTVQNNSTTSVTVLMSTVNLPSDWTVAWQGNNTVLAPTEKAGGWLNLTIAATATEWPDWSFLVKAVG